MKSSLKVVNKNPPVDVELPKVFIELMRTHIPLKYRRQSQSNIERLARALGVSDVDRENLFVDLRGRRMSVADYDARMARKEVVVEWISGGSEEMSYVDAARLARLAPHTLRCYTSAGRMYSTAIVDEHGSMDPVNIRKLVK